MDSLFDVIIALVIIYSLVSPFLGKKKGKQPPQTKGQRQPHTMRQPLPHSQPPPGRSEPSDVDILREIENLFKETRMEPAPPRIPVPPPKESYSSESSKSDSLEDKWGEHVKVESERVSYESSTPEYVFTPPKPIQLKKFKPLPEVQSKKSSDINLRTKNLKAKFANPLNIRDYFIVSEILGKPKALKRNLRA
ncbi:MAG TPA: hypothetical protein PKY46_09885 [Ignavibacteriaceae bacterium]|nr:hypothetical protein [Ignavibacteriaceae bacterium]